MGTTERLQSPRPHDPSQDVRPSGDVMTSGDEAPDPAEDLIEKVIGGGDRKSVV